MQAQHKLYIASLSSLSFFQFSWYLSKDCHGEVERGTCIEASSANGVGAGCKCLGQCSLQARP